MYDIIICEGNTDAILISYYLKNTLKYKHKNDISTEMPKINNVDMEINWYKGENDKYLAIGSIGGNDFMRAISSVMGYNKASDRQRIFQRIALVMDNDDETVCDSIRSIGVYVGCEKELLAGQWESFAYENDFGETIGEEIVCILQPNNEYGALETFVLEALCHKDDEDKKVVDQVRNFIEGFQSEKYLQKRREKIKANLSVSLSVMYPTRAFIPINEFLESIQWNKYEVFQEQFSLFAHLKDDDEVLNCKNNT